MEILGWIVITYVILGIGTGCLGYSFATRSQESLDAWMYDVFKGRISREDLKSWIGLAMVLNGFVWPWYFWELKQAGVFEKQHTETSFLDELLASPHHTLEEKEEMYRWHLLMIRYHKTAPNRIVRKISPEMMKMKIEGDEILGMTYIQDGSPMLDLEMNQGDYFVTTTDIKGESGKVLMKKFYLYRWDGYSMNEKDHPPEEIMEVDLG